MPTRLAKPALAPIYDAIKLSKADLPQGVALRVIIMRSKGEHIGTVEAPDRERAEAVTIKQFDLNQDQQRPASDAEAILTVCAIR